MLRCPQLSADVAAFQRQHSVEFVQQINSASYHKFSAHRKLPQLSNFQQHNRPPCRTRSTTRESPSLSSAKPLYCLQQVECSLFAPGTCFLSQLLCRCKGRLILFASVLSTISSTHRHHCLTLVVCLPYCKTGTRRQQPPLTSQRATTASATR